MKSSKRDTLWLLEMNGGRDLILIDFLLLFFPPGNLTKISITLRRSYLHRRERALDLHPYMESLFRWSYGLCEHGANC